MLGWAVSESNKHYFVYKTNNIFPFFSENYKFLTTMISFSLFSFLGEITQPTTPRRRRRLRVRADWNRHSRFLKSFSRNLFTNVMFCWFAIPNNTNKSATSSSLQLFTEFSCLCCWFDESFNWTHKWHRFSVIQNKSSEIFGVKKKANTLFFASCWSLQLTQMKKIVKAKTE